MNFIWNEATIRWYREANAYTGFFKNIAGLIAPRLKGYTTLCDVGCGMALIDIELSKYIDNITCLDINATVIEEVQKAIKEKEISNITACRMDCNDISQNFDVICVSFFAARDLTRLLPFCKKLVAVVSKKSSSEFIPDKYRKFQKGTVEDTKLILLKAGIPYVLTEASFEFGQPFVSVEDARKFIRNYSPDISSAELSDFLAKRLVETGDKQYPFSIPRMKSVGIFEIKGEL